MTETITMKIEEQLEQMRSLIKTSTEYEYTPISNRRGHKAVYDAYLSLVEHHNTQSRITNEVLTRFIDILQLFFIDWQTTLRMETE